MRKSLLLVAVASALGAPAVATAQTPAAAPASPHTITGNVAIVSDYRFRGISQTFGKPALQGGFDYAHSSGFYAGNWNSNVSETAGFPNGNLEMDFYGGYKKSFGDIGFDVGAIYYYYPGTTAAGSAGAGVVNADRALAGHPDFAATGGKVDNTEFYVGATWKWLSAKFFYALDEYFSTPGTKGTTYLDVGATYDLGGGWGINGHIGRLNVKQYGSAKYTDYKIGVTKDISGYVFGASLVATNAKDDCSPSAPVPQPYCFVRAAGSPLAPQTYEGGKNTVVLSVSKTF